MRDYGNVPVWQSAAIMALIGILGGLHMMIFTPGVAFVSRRSVGAGVCVRAISLGDAWNLFARICRSLRFRGI